MKIEISPTAENQLVELIEWWDENRRSARVRLEDAFATALEVIASDPNIGRIYAKANQYRTKQLIGTPYYLVYRVDDGAQEIRVVAVWSAIRGKDPPLG